MLRRSRHRPRRSPAVRKTHPPPAPPRLGRLCQARLRRTHAGVALPRPLHPSRGHFQSSLVGLRPRTRHLSLEGLRPRRQAWQDDTCAHRVLTALFSARAPQGGRAYPLLWLPRQSLSCSPLGSIPTPAVEQLLHASRSWTLQSFGGGFFCLALPTLRRDHDRGSEIHGCGIINMFLLRFFITPLPLSTRGCAQARRCTRLSASSPLPRKQISARTLAHLSRRSDHPDGHPTTPRRSPQAPFRSRLPFKSHSAPLPPQTPAASS